MSNGMHMNASVEVARKLMRTCRYWRPSQLGYEVYGRPGRKPQAYSRPGARLLDVMRERGLVCVHNESHQARWFTLTRKGHAS